MTARLIPFGLRFGEAPSERHRLDLPLAEATLDPDLQVAVLDGRPITENENLDVLMGSSPTETDGDSVISTDSDPIYD